jgi:hypothetical protein
VVSGSVRSFRPPSEKRYSTVSVDEATRVEVYNVPAVRWRRLVLAGLDVPQSIPPTSGGHDPVCPFWEMGSEQPASLASIQGAHPRVGGVCPFSPRDLIGSPGVAGAGYVLHKIVGGPTAIVQPGDIREIEERITLEAWFHLPKTTAPAIRGAYTGAYRQLWQGVVIPAEDFAPHFTGFNPIFQIQQIDDMSSPVPQGELGAYDVILQQIPLRRNELRTGNQTIN